MFFINICKCLVFKSSSKVMERGGGFIKYYVTKKLVKMENSPFKMFWVINLSGSRRNEGEVSIVNVVDMLRLFSKYFLPL